METNWKLLLTARAIPVSDEEMMRLVPAMSALEEGLAALKPLLEYETEPAVVLSEEALNGE